jgi:hypothetical protein
LAVIKVGNRDACECDTVDIPYFIMAYHSLWPKIDLFVNDREVAWFDSKMKCVVEVASNITKIYKFDYKDGKYLWVN